MGPHELGIRQPIEASDTLIEADRRALYEAFRIYYGTDERVTMDFLRGIGIVLLALYGCEALIAATRIRQKSKERESTV